jgi:hypothetical protein
MRASGLRARKSLMAACRAVCAVSPRLNSRAEVNHLRLRYTIRNVTERRRILVVGLRQLQKTDTDSCLSFPARSWVDNNDPMFPFGRDGKVAAPLRLAGE